MHATGHVIATLFYPPLTVQALSLESLIRCVRRNPGLVQEAGMGGSRCDGASASRCELACDGSGRRIHCPVCQGKGKRLFSGACGCGFRFGRSLPLARSVRLDGACGSWPERRYTGHTRTASRLVLLENMAGLVLLWPAFLFPAMNSPHPPTGSEVSMPRGPGSCTPG